MASVLMLASWFVLGIPGIEICLAQEGDATVVVSGSRLERLATSRLFSRIQATEQLGDEIVSARRSAAHDEGIRPTKVPSSAAAPRPDSMVPQPDQFLAALFALLPLFASLVVSAVKSVSSHMRARAPATRSAPASSVRLNFEQECRNQLDSAVNLWRTAESAIFELDSEHPLRTLLLNDLRVIGRRLSMRPALSAVHDGAIALNLTPHYWRILHRDIASAVRELKRICSVATAASVSIGGQNSAPRFPKDLREAYFVLGVNPDVSEDTLKRLVRALRQCWHPDVAQNDGDRSYREARIRQINVANDLIMKGVNQMRA